MRQRPADLCASSLAAENAWTAAAAITNGAVLRAINKAGRVWGNGMSPKVLWDIVRAAAARASIDKLAPHDLRRTCARLCHLAGGELDQTQFLLGLSVPCSASARCPHRRDFSLFVLADGPGRGGGWSRLWTWRRCTPRSVS
jgi:hypothetical protein